MKVIILADIRKKLRDAAYAASLREIFGDTYCNTDVKPNEIKNKQGTSRWVK